MNQSFAPPPVDSSSNGISSPAAATPACAPPTAPDEGRFKVHLGGILEVLSRHLYSQGSRVFVRELLQNAVDAITVRRRTDKSCKGRVEVAVTKDRDGGVTVMVADNGAGMTWAEARECLATIGYSSKAAATGPLETIGQFGIGLLSGFLAADEIHVVSRPLDGGAGFWWKGRITGDWTQGPLREEVEAGTRVFLHLRAGEAAYFTPLEVRRLARLYGGHLPHTLIFRDGEAEYRINRGRAPWEIGGDQEAALLEAGEKSLGKRFLGALRFDSPETGSAGVAFIEKEAAAPGADPAHQLYVRRMLVGEKIRGLAPAALPFLRLVVNSDSLRVNAAREGLHGEETRLEGLQTDVLAAVEGYLSRLAESEPERAALFVRTQAECLLRAADEDGLFLGLLRRFYPLETSQGSLCLDEILRRHRSAEYVTDETEYFKIETRARQEGLCVVRATYRQAGQVIAAAERVLPRGMLKPVRAGEFLARFARATGVQSSRERELLDWAAEELRTENCAAELAEQDDPYEAASLAMEDQESIGRLLDGGSFTGTGPQSMSKRLLLNRNHRVIESWLTDAVIDAAQVKRWLRVFYHLALLNGKETPTAGEQRRLCRALEQLALQS